MKKLTLLLACLMLFTACSKNENQADMSSYAGMKDKNQYRTGDYEEITKNMKEFKEGVYVVAHPGLNASLAIVPALNNILKSEKKEAFYIDMSLDDEFTTNVNRRIVDFDQSLDLTLQSGDHRPFIVVIDSNGIVKTFHSGMTDIEFTREPLNDTDKQTLKTAIQSSLFN